VRRLGAAHDRTRGRGTLAGSGRHSRRPAASAWLATALVLAALGCDSLPSPPGKPTEAERYVPPAEVTGFEPLFATHCSGCHGADGVLGPARSLHDALYLAIVPTKVLEQKIRAGVAGTPMPAFAQAEGGPLTDAQLQALVEGMQRSWGGDVPGPLPAYAGTRPGDPQRGRAAFVTFCAQCHGADGRGAGKRGGSVVDSAYLGLVSDQGLRTSVMVGRKDLGTPDWRSYVAGRPMTEREIADVVAWLVSRRPRYPGQPYPEAGSETASGARAAAHAPREGSS
jgi:mono/diheme cytochrome c family protein